MKDKKYRPEVDGPKLPPVTNKPIEPGYVKPTPPGAARPAMPGVIKPGGRPSGRPLRKGYATITPINRPGKPSDVDTIQPVRPGARPGLPMPSDSQRNATMEAIKKMQEKMAMEAARKKSGK